MELFCNASPGAKKHASAMFLLLCFLFGSLAWYTRFPLGDFEALHSGLPAEPDGLENGVDHGLERGPAIEWGHDASTHEHPGITVSKAVVYETGL